MAPKYAKVCGGTRKEHPWNGHTYHWGRNCTKLGCGLQRWKLGGGRHPCGIYLSTEEYVYLCPLFVRGSASEVEELDWGWGLL